MYPDCGSVCGQKARGGWRVLPIDSEPFRVAAVCASFLEVRCLAMNDPMAMHLAQANPNTLHDLLEAVARKNPAARAAADMNTELTYGAMTERVDAYAMSLLAAGVRHGDRVAIAVMLHNQRMVDGEIRGLLVEIDDRITPRGHRLANQLIPLRYCDFRSINEFRLHQPPSLHKSGLVGRRKCVDFESFYSLFKLGKSLFASCGASRFLNGAAVLRPKPGAKPPAFLRSRR